MRLSSVILLAASLTLGFTTLAQEKSGPKKPRPVELPWSFHVPVRPAVPKVAKPAWVRNPIDAFILAKLEQKELTPSPEIDRAKLLRRVYFDLIGLPPTPQEVQSFLNDKRPDAYEKVVDHLLQSPHYGERSALYWLDLVRFAESDGFKADDFRPNAWRYRDYIIKSFNADKPYDRFILEQLAGDELFPGDPDALIATAFNRHFADEFNARNLDQRRQEILNDMTDVTSQVFLGLTLGCARCHDHKYDPIPQKDYYRFQAFFAAFSPQDDLPLGTKQQLAKHDQQMAEWQTKAGDLLQKIAKLEEPYAKKLAGSNKSKFSKELQSAYDTPPEKRTPFQQQIADMLAKQLEVDKGQMTKMMKADVKKEWDDLSKQMQAFDNLKPKPLPQSVGITDVGPVAPPTFLLKRGSHKHPLEEVQPGFLSAIDKSQPSLAAPKFAKTTGRRAALAQWLASAKNPLTARVMVNRLWQQHFGKGLVATASDFGEQGERPTHPELLDWLATEFIAQGWSMKEMRRLMVTSSTYRQASVRIAANEEIDPDNRLLWKMNLRRLEGEALRDAMLLVAGKLNLKMSGPSVFPKLPKGVDVPASWKTTPDTSEHNRRSIYLVVKRNLRFPLFAAFDAPDTNETCSARHVSTTAPQALMLLNDEFSLHLAKDFAGQLLQTHGVKTPKEAIHHAFQLALGRAPDAKELTLSLKFFTQQMPLMEQRLAKKTAVALPSTIPALVPPAFAAATVEYCHVVLNLNEFVYVD